MKKPETKPETKPREIVLEDLEPTVSVTELVKGGGAAIQIEEPGGPIKKLRGGWDGN